MFVSSEVLSSLHLEILSASSASAFEKVLEADDCDFLSAALTAHCQSFIHSFSNTEIPISGCQLIKENKTLTSYEKVLLSESLHRTEIRQGGRCFCSLCGFCFPLQNTWIAFWLSVTADSSQRKKQLSVERWIGNIKHWFFCDGETDRIKCSSLFHCYFRLKYLRRRHFESVRGWQKAFKLLKPYLPCMRRVCRYS